MFLLLCKILRLQISCIIENVGQSTTISLGKFNKQVIALLLFQLIQHWVQRHFLVVHDKVQGY